VSGDRAPRTFGAAAAGLALVAVLLGLPGASSLPLDMHEIYVAQTAREMAERGDWIVPYFNGEPRLNKPPLSYWLAGALAWAAGDLPRIAEWHARAVSIAAGAVLVLVTVAMGALVLGRASALLGGLLLAASAGLFSALHDARPDPLYAALSMAALAALAWSAERAAAGVSTWPAAAALWLAVAAATLAKGPHLPALMLVGGVIHLRREGRGWAEIARIARPLAGLAVAAALAAPWWLVVATRLPEGQLAASQLSGRLLLPSLAHLGNPYFFYRPLEMLVPWLPLVLLALAPGFAARQTRWGWILWPLGVSLAGLSLAPQQRLVYALPLLGLMALALAHALAPLAGGALDARGRRLAWIALVLQLAIAAGLLGFAAYRTAPAAPLLAWAGTAAALGFAAALLALGARAGRAPLAALGAAAALAAAAWPIGTPGAAWWSAERFEARSLARLAAERLPAGAVLATFDVNPAAYIYYSGRRVHVLDSERALAERLAGQGRVFLATRVRHLGALSARHAVQVIARGRRAGEEEALVLVAEPRR
jgi:4-amino-4-deoxy-L-arabinose transferase-like glycosyltransferase